MKHLKPLFLLLVLVLPLSSVRAEGSRELTVSAEDVAFVQAWPSYYDFGSVKSPFTRSTSITFSNNGDTDIRFFNVHCMGDLSAFQCSTSCFSLPRYSSCHVWVTFSPRSGDGMRKWVSVQGMGDGAFATADVYGTDEKGSE